MAQASTDDERRDRFRGCLMGLAVGDAVGTTVEFKARGSFEPIQDMVGGGPFHLLPGQWTDDTSMALCLAESLLERGDFDARDAMSRWCRWMETGYWSSNGRCFDIGNTVSAALRRFRYDGDPFSGSTDARSAGNGCIMRLAPVPMYFSQSPELAESIAGESSRTTHGAAECIDASKLFCRILLRALAGSPKDDAIKEIEPIPLCSHRLMSIARGEFQVMDEPQIKGSGYVVDCLEAALWCFHQSDSFEDAILRATNLGDDADTTAAVCGQIAGAHYGASRIPAHWIKRLAMADEIEQLADRIFAASSMGS